jgi:hypothetical protein
MATLRKIPDVSVPVVNPTTGLMTEAWFLYFKSRELAGLSNLIDVAIGTPSNGDVLTYNSTSKKWEPTP